MPVNSGTLRKEGNALIFDHLAEAARELYDISEGHFFEEYQAMPPLYHQNMIESIKEAIPALYNEEGDPRQLESSDLSVNSKVAKQIIAFIEDAEAKKDYKRLMVLIETVCGSLLNYVEGLSTLTTDFCPIDYLNANHESTKVIILPDFKCNWQQ